MKSEYKKKLINFLMLVGMIVFLLVGFYLIVYQFNFQKNECINSPLVYGAAQLTEAFGFEFYGYGTFETPPDIKGVILNFNSTSLAINENS